MSELLAEILMELRAIRMLLESNTQGIGQPLTVTLEESAAAEQIEHELLLPVQRRWLESQSVCTEFPAEYAFKAAQDLKAIEHGFTCAMEQLKADSRFDPLARSAFLRPLGGDTSAQTPSSGFPPAMDSAL